MDAILDKLNVVINGETEEAIEQALKDLGMLEITLPQIHVRNKENTTKRSYKESLSYSDSRKGGSKPAWHNFS